MRFRGNWKQLSYVSPLVSIVIENWKQNAFRSKQRYQNDNWIGFIFLIKERFVFWHLSRQLLWCNSFPTRVLGSSRCSTFSMTMGESFVHFCLRKTPNESYYQKAHKYLKHWNMTFRHINGTYVRWSARHARKLKTTSHHECWLLQKTKSRVRLKVSSGISSVLTTELAFIVWKNG